MQTTDQIIDEILLKSPYGSKAYEERQKRKRECEEVLPIEDAVIDHPQQITMSKDIRVKDLDNEITMAQQELDIFKKEISELNQILHDKKQNLHSLKLKKRKRTKVNDVYVIDSAIVAYFEKVCNYDMKKIRETIIPTILNSNDEYLIDGWYDVGDFEVLVKKGRVIDVDVEYEDDTND